MQVSTFLRLRWTQVRQKPGVVLASLLLVFVITLATSLALIESSIGKRFILARVQKYLRDNRGIALSVTRFDYDLSTLSIFLEGAVFTSTTAPGLPPFLKLDRAQTSVRLWPLSKTSTSITLANSNVNGVHLHIIVNELGQTNLPAVKPQSQTSLSYGFSLLEVTEGTFLFEDLRRQVTVELPVWNLTVKGDTSAYQHRVEFQTSDDGSLRHGKTVFPLRHVRAGVVVEKDTFFLDTFQLGLEKSQVQVAGRINRLADLSLTSQLRMHLDLEEIRQLAGFDKQWKGSIDGQIAIRSEDAHQPPELAGDLTLSPNVFQEVGAVQLDFQAHWLPQQIRISSLMASSSHGAGQGEAILDLSGDGRSEAALRFQQVDLERLSRQLNLPVQLVTKAQGTLRVNWQGTDIAAAAGQAQILLRTETGSAQSGRLPLSGRLSLQFMNQLGSLTISSLQAPGAEFDGQVTLGSNQSLAGEVKGEIRDAAEFIGGVQELFGNRRIQRFPVEGRASMAMYVGGSLSNPNLRTTVDAPSLRINRLADVALHAIGEARRDRIVSQSELIWMGGRIHAGGQVVPNGRSSKVALTVEAENIAMPTIAAALNREIPVSGQLQAKAQIDGTIENLHGNLTLSGTDLKAYQENLGNLHLDAQLSNQTLKLTELRLAKPGVQGGQGLLVASGQYNLHSKAYTLRAGGGNFSISSLVLPGNVPIRGNVSFSIRGEGVREHRELEVTADATEVSINQEAIGTIGLSTQLNDDLLTFRTEAPTYKLISTGNVVINAPYRAEFELHANNTDISNFKIRTGKTEILKGRLSAHVQGKGELANWKSGELLLRLDQLDLTAGDQAIRNEGPVEAKYADGIVSVPRGVLVADKSRIEIQGSLPVLKGHEAGSIELVGYTELGTVVPFLPSTRDIFSSGRLEFTATVSGTFQSYTPSGTIKLTDGFFFTPDLLTPLTDAQADLQVKEGVVILNEAKGHWSSGLIAASGSLPLALLPSLPFQFPRAEGVAKLRLDVTDLQPDSIPTMPADTSGVIDLHVTAEAPSLTPKAITGKGVFDRFEFKLTEFNVHQSQPVEFSMRDGVFRIEPFELLGAGTQVRGSGQANLIGDQSLDLHAKGDVEAGIFTFLFENLRMRGATNFQADIGGTLKRPEVSGFLVTHDGLLALESPRLQAENLDIRLVLGQNRLTIEKFTGLVNGGTLKVQGSSSHSGIDLNSVAIDVALDRVFLEFPENLKSTLDTNLTLRSDGRLIYLGGDVRILEGSYTAPLQIEEEVLEALRTGERVELTETPSPLLSRIRYNVNINTRRPIVVDNNLAKAMIRSNLRLLGSYYRPALTGRLTLQEGGEIYFSQNRYLVERGSIIFANQTTIEPSLDIFARARSGGYDINLQLSGNPKNLEASFTSDPPLPQPDVVSVLLTGKTLDQFRGQEMDVAKSQAFSYLTGRVGSPVALGLEKGLGLSRVRIEPSLIAEESDPGDRLTVGQDLTKDVRLIYSMNLTDSQDQIWIAEYDMTRRFQTRGIKQEDNSYRYEFQHELRFGGPPRAGRISDTRRTKKELGAVEFTGNLLFPQEKLQSQLKLKPGDDFDFFKLRKGLERLDNLYAKQDRLEANLQVDQQPTGSRMSVKLRIEAGPQVNLMFQGAEVSNDVRQKVRDTWNEGVFDSQRVEESVQVIRRGFVEQGFLEARVEHSIDQPSPDLKRVIFQITPNIRYENVSIAFEGTVGIKPDELEQKLEEAGLKTVYLEPKQVQSFLSKYYREQGYLDASVDPPRVELAPATRSGNVRIRVTEGPLFKLGEIRFQNNKHFTMDRLRQTAALHPGQTYQPKLLQQSRLKLEQLYSTNGFVDVEINELIDRRSALQQIHLIFDIHEGKQSIVREISIEGNDQTTDQFITKQVELVPGNALDPEKINRTRHSLYTSGSYSLVDIVTEAIEGKLTEASQKPVRVRVKVRELRPYDLRYGGLYDTERGAGGSAAWTHRNFFGSARVFGASIRYDSQLQSVRTYFSQPYIQRLRLKTSVAAFARRAQPANLAFETEEMGFSVLQESQLRNRFRLSYGYQFERSNTFDKEPDPLVPDRFGQTLSVASLIGTLTRETRNDLLDAVRGSFISHAFEIAPRGLGGSLPFLKYYGQYYKYIPLSKPAEVPYQHGFKQPRLVFATSVRAGLAKTLGDAELIRSKRFFAGGGTTLRGFAQNLVGPLDDLGQPFGGNAVFILNNEIRFPLVHIFDGAGFIDIGNVYRTVADFDPLDVRKSAGIGLRLRTPYFLVRVDYGLKLDRRPGESHGGLFFSIGQAF